jgi:pimeloyl-ACP methyl ester carboxylesterase
MRRRRIRWLLLLLSAAVTVLAVGASAQGPDDAQPAAAPFPGTRTDYLGFGRYDFEADGQAFTVAVPRSPAPGRPWLWVAEFFGHAFWHGLDAALLARGWHIAYNASAAGLYGSPRAVANWSASHAVWTRRFGLDPRPVLAGYSRGGLLVYNWAAANADKVRAIYADAPVCRIQSWPGGTGAGRGSPVDWQQCLAAYGLTEVEGVNYALNPIDRLAALARAQVPLLHVVGDADDVVPVAENTQLVEERYRALGGAVQVIHKPGVGHHPHALPDPAPIVAFILEHGPPR